MATYAGLNWVHCTSSSTAPLMLQLQRAGEDVNVWFASLNARLELEDGKTFYIDEVSITS